MGRMIGSGTVVTGLTAAALAAVGLLAMQASAAPDHTGKAKATAPHSPASPASPATTARPDTVTALPAASGLGRRVVYSLERKRVWLVDAGGQVQRTYTVAPGSVSPAPGTYSVNSRSDRIPGSDGVLVEHVVRFATAKGTTVGFSAAVDGSMPAPDPAKKTGGVREKVADGTAMWQFALIAAKVVVIP